MLQKRSILKKPWVWIAAFLFWIWVSGFFFVRLDLTAEKRFSLTQPTKNMLQHLDSTVQIQVFLTGDLPADYKKLSIATRDLLDEFRAVSGNHVQVQFAKPGNDLQNDSARVILYDSLSRLGVVFDNTERVSASSEKQTQQLIIPAALVSFRPGQRPVAIDLRSSRKVYKPYNVITDNAPQEDVEATRNAAEALLEFKFADAINKLTRKTIPTVAYLTGNGEPVDFTVNDLGESLRNEYRLAVFDLKKGYPDPA
ncbi:MAG TPA: GldG family protein, partial [Sediminibacterium sp.]|nr:GldG family protein [Sediminibacterium sp.]